MDYVSDSNKQINKKIKKGDVYSSMQWWILGEASEVIASGPFFFTVVEGPLLFENAVCNFILWYFMWFHEPQKLSKVLSFQQTL